MSVHHYVLERQTCRQVLRPLAGAQEVDFGFGLVDELPHVDRCCPRPGHVGARDWPAAKVLALEVGFHCEHPKEPDNEAVLTRLAANERRWRRDVGKEAEVGTFLGRAEHWRRISEVWPDPDLSEPGLAFEIASRLVDYMTALEPLLRAR